MATQYAPWRARLLRGLVFATVTLGIAGSGIATAANDATTLSRQAIDQIAALIAEKDARSDVEKKIDSQLLYASRIDRGASAAPGVSTLDTGISADAHGLVDVEIRAMLTPDLQQAINAVRGEIIRAFAFANTVEALLPLSGIHAIAALPSVSFIAPKAQGMTTRAVNPSFTNRLHRPGVAHDSLIVGADVTTGAVSEDNVLSPRLGRFKETVKRALDARKIGGRSSEGDHAHRANDARNAFSVNGAGLRIGVLSDSFNNLNAAAADITAGDLPGPGNPNGFTTAVGLAGSGDLASGGSDEGRAMLQIVHDLAPGATLYFATAFNSITDFANNIRALRGIATSPASGNITPGCDIIIDDIFYFTETGLHDGQTFATNRNMALVTQAVNDVTADGAMYFSSAGNSGNLAQATSGAWEGDFTSGNKPSVVTGPGDALIWSGTDVGNTITSGTNTVSMQWSDPLGGSTNDYDLFRLDATLTTVLASSTNVQTGTQDPFEQLTAAANTRLVVVRRAGAAARFISLSTNRGRLQYGTNGQIRGHSGAANGYAVAATPAVSPGPDSGPFVASNVTETFSSDGPRRVFYAANGSAITAGNLLAATNGGLLRAKPDLTAADGVVTTLPLGGLNPFYGTSAAAPHLGAIAALVKQAAPSASTAQIRSILTSTALDIMSPGVDVTSGPGIAQAFQAVQATGAAGVASLGLGTVTVSGDNNRIDPGDCNTLTIALVNNGAATATAVSAVLTTTTPGVSIAQGSSLYANITAAGSQNNAVPFSVSTSAAAANATTINFALTVNYAGGASPTVLSFTLPLGVDINNYGFIASSGATIPAGGTLIPGSAADDAVITVTAPFAFSVFGTPVTAGQTVTVSTNGNIQFVASGGAVSEANGALPSSTFANVSVLMPFWDDLLLTTAGGGIFTNTVGTSPNRQLIVEWRGRRFNDGASTQNINFAVAFNEGSNDFRYLYAQTGTGVALNGISATVGVQKGSAVSAKFAQYSFNQGVITPGLILAAAFPAAMPGTGACFALPAPPDLAYAPTTGTTVAFTGVTTVGSTGSGFIAVTPSGGFGSGAASTSTVNGCTITGPDAANFAGAGSVNLSFVGTTTTAQNVSLSCTSGSVASSATLSCNETIGTGAATPRTWPLSCPLGASAPQFSYVPTTGTTVTATGGALVGSTGALLITPSVATAGSGTGATATTTLTCTPPTAPFTGFAQSVTATGSGAISGGPLSGSCTLGTSAQTQTLSCSENRGGTIVPVSWTIACPLGNAPPALAYNPTAGSPVAFTGVTTVGSTGNGTIAITPSSGSGTGVTATSTVNGCTLTGADAASFAGASSVNLGFVGSTTTAQNIALTCVSGSAARSATLSCNETIGTGAASLRSWPLACPVGNAAPQFGYAPATGTTVASTGGSLVGSTASFTITPSVTTAGTGSGALATTTLTCTPPTGAFSGFAQTVTATGAGAISGGPLSGSCTLGATIQTQTLSCTENRAGTSTPVSWTLSCDVGNNPPALAYNPTMGSTIPFARVSTIGSTGVAAIAVTPSGGSGAGTAATSTINNCTFSGADAASFAVVGPLSLSFVGTTTTAQNIGLSCTAGSSDRSAALACDETIGNGVTAPRYWAMSCPRGCSLDINGDGIVTADRDGVLLSRYLQGFRGAGLVADVPLGPARADARAVETFLGSARQLDVFGRPVAAATGMQDGLVLVRLMLGVPDVALLGGITMPPEAQFTSGLVIRENVNTRCGTSF